MKVVDIDIHVYRTRCEICGAYIYGLSESGVKEKLVEHLIKCHK